MFSSVQSLSRVRLFATPLTAARQASLSITNSQSSLKLMSIESVIPSSHLILCRPLLLPPIPPSIRVFSNESTLHMRWPKYWSCSFSIIPSKEYSGLISYELERCDESRSEAIRFKKSGVSLQQQGTRGHPTNCWDQGCSKRQSQQLFKELVMNDGS